MNRVALRLDGVRKSFGRTEVLRELSFSVPAGSICGFVGPNGAGKTTAFSIICGFLQPDGGKIDLLGEGPFSVRHHRGRVTALPQDAIMPPQARLIDLLVLYAALQQIPRTARREEAMRVLAMVDLADHATMRVKSLSHGMRRRLEVAQAFLGTPDLILLDEPTNGLDPRQALTLRQAIAAHRGVRTILVSSHNLLELERLCDHVIMIEGGRTVQAGTIEEITGKNEEVEIRFAPGEIPIAPLREAMPDCHFTLDPEEHTLLIRFRPTPDRSAEDVITDALRIAIGAGARIATVSRGSSLEHRFMERL